MKDDLITLPIDNRDVVGAWVVCVCLVGTLVCLCLTAGFLI